MPDAIELDVPALPRIVPARIFDAWSWCASDRVEWRRTERFTTEGRIGGDNPAGLAFVLRARCAFLPSELARLHAFGYGLEDELALAPWAIDDATDGLFEHRVRPRDLFWIAADSLEALVWALHDWAHFHNHGPFDEPAMTELQCDLVALAWLRANATRIGIDAGRADEVARDLEELSRRRFAAEGRPAPDVARLFAGDYPVTPLDEA